MMSIGNAGAWRSCAPAPAVHQRRQSWQNSTGRTPTSGAARTLVSHPDDLVSAQLEAAFVEDCRRAGLCLSRTAPVCLDTLRWGWRRSVLNYNDDPGWRRALAAARKRQAKIGPPPEDYIYTPPADTPPTNSRIRAVLQRLNAFQRAQTRPPVDRTTKAKARKAHSHRFRAPASFDWHAFLAEHWSSTFGPLFAAHQLDPSEVDGELGRRLAVTWRAVLDEQAQLGQGVCGSRITAGWRWGGSSGGTRIKPQGTICADPDGLTGRAAQDGAARSTNPDCRVAGSAASSPPSPRSRRPPWRERWDAQRGGTGAPLRGQRRADGQHLPDGQAPTLMRYSGMW